MVFGPHVGLDPLSCRSSARKNVLASRVAADKGDSFDIGRVADVIDAIVSAVDDV